MHDGVNDCCELLSNFGYIGIGNNLEPWKAIFLLVVNCFQILAILGLETTANQWPCLCVRCELLSNFGYIGIGNNYDFLQNIFVGVVNCFQILAILGLETTNSYNKHHRD